MRESVDVKKLEELMRGLAQAARSAGKVYFTGGSSALLLGIRNQTIDVDLKFDPEPIGIFEAVEKLKNQLKLNIELASPDDFIPVQPDWRERSKHIETIGQLSFFHFDFCAQALAKIERGFDQDRSDVQALIEQEIVSYKELLEMFRQIKPDIIRYPGIDAAQFERKLQDFCKGQQK